MRFICAFYVLIVCDKTHIIFAEDLTVKGFSLYEETHPNVKIVQDATKRNSIR